MTDWKPISEYPFPTDADRYGPHNDMPDGPEVLVFSPARPTKYGYIEPATIRVSKASPDEREKWGWWVGAQFDSDELEPTHWAPLPEPPLA